MDPKRKQGKRVPVLSHLLPTQQLLEEVSDSRLDQLPAHQTIRHSIGNEAGVVDAGCPFSRLSSNVEFVVEVAHVFQVEPRVFLKGNLRNCISIAHQRGDGGCLGP